jgi:hypothetical protein
MFLEGPLLGSDIPFTSFKAADLPLPPKSVTRLREGNGLFLVPSEREDIRATTNP